MKAYLLRTIHLYELILLYLPEIEIALVRSDNGRALKLEYLLDIISVSRDLAEKDMLKEAIYQLRRLQGIFCAKGICTSEALNKENKEYHDLLKQGGHCHV